jgi:hypothetical protein
MAYGRLLVTMGISSAVALAVACGGSTSDGGSPATDAGGGSDGTATTDGGADSAETFDSASDTGTTTSDGGATGTINCGMNATCNAATQVCCAMAGGGGPDAAGGGATESCVAIGACTGGASVSCEGSSNCTGGDVCCADFGGGGGGGGGGMLSTTCAPSCATGEVQVCGASTDCTAPETCHMLGNGLGICRAPMGDGGFHGDGGFPTDGGGFPPPQDAAAE